MQQYLLLPQLDISKLQQETCSQQNTAKHSSCARRCISQKFKNSLRKSQSQIDQSKLLRDSRGENSVVQQSNSMLLHSDIDVKFKYSKCQKQRNQNKSDVSVCNSSFRLREPRLNNSVIFPSVKRTQQVKEKTIQNQGHAIQYSQSTQRNDPFLKSLKLQNVQVQNRQLKKSLQQKLVEEDMFAENQE